MVGTGTPDSLNALLSEIGGCHKPDGSAILVGIDGCGGSGKSTLARALARAAVDCSVVEMDDFYLPSRHRLTSATRIGGAFDWRRLKQQVLTPLSDCRDGRYQRYDWSSDALDDWRDVPNRGIVLVEGVTTTRRELRDYYNFRIWVDTPRDTRLARGLARDGETARTQWLEDWMPAEDAYAAEHAPADSAHRVIDSDEMAAFAIGHAGVV